MIQYKYFTLILSLLLLEYTTQFGDQSKINIYLKYPTTTFLLMNDMVMVW